MDRLLAAKICIADQLFSKSTVKDGFEWIAKLDAARAYIEPLG